MLDKSLSYDTWKVVMVGQSLMIFYLERKVRLTFNLVGSIGS